MSTIGYRRERMSKYAIRSLAADACRYIDTVGEHAELDCPRCAQTVRTRRTEEDVYHEGGPLWAVLLEHLFRECPAVDYFR